MCELALRLGMTLSDLSDRASAHEVGVVWPAYFRYEQRERDRRDDVKRSAPTSFQAG